MDRLPRLRGRDGEGAAAKDACADMPPPGELRSRPSPASGGGQERKNAPTPRSDHRRLARRADRGASVAQRGLGRVIHSVRRRWRLKIALRGAALLVAPGLATFAVSAYAMDHFRYEPWAVTAFRLFAYVTLLALAGRFLVVPLWARVTEDRV